MELLEKAQQVFSGDRFATELAGVAIQSVGSHEAVCTMTVDARHCNARSVAMGGALFTLADFTAAVAANTDHLTDGTDLQWVSLDANAHFLAPAQQGERLEATATAVRHGRAVALYRVDIKKDSGKLVATVEFTMVRA